MKRLFFIGISVSIIFLFCLVGIAHAVVSSVIETEVSVNITPEHPGPNTSVNVSIESYATDLNASTVTWKINGVTQKKGTGIKTFSFTTGSVNVTKTLDIVIQTPEGETITKTYTIKPVDVDLVWQANGYTPPFYKGKALMSYQNTIRFVAVPHMLNSEGKEISPKNLIYKWTRNGTVLGDYSGYGKDSYTLIQSIIARPIDMEVEVTSSETGGVGYAETYVAASDPQILLYEKSPLYGIQFQKALTGTVNLNSSKEITVVAAPYYFGTTNNADSGLTYLWSLNGETIGNGDNKTVKTFRQESDNSGSSYISLSIDNANKILQHASNGFTLSFGTGGEKNSQSF